jgi:hypothetical protein
MNTGPTIPDALWQACLTILGAVIGAIVADRVARRGERKRNFQAAAYDFDVIASKLLFLVQKERHNLASLLKNNYSELERAVFRVRFYLDADCRTEFDAHWKQYASIQHGQLQAGSVRMSEGGGMIQDYTNACKVMSEPLATMVQIVQQAAQ